MLSGAREVVLVIPQGKNRFVEKVPYVTAPGGRATMAVSTHGVFEKPAGAHEFTLTACFPTEELPTAGACVEHIKKNCGWELRIADKLIEEPPPDVEELRLLRLFDPNKFFTEDG